MLSLKRLTKIFGGLTAVAEMDLTVEESTITGLIGPNGAGKTTIFNLISGFLKPDGGEILYKDSPIHGLPPHRVFHLGIMRSFQISRELARMTVLDNLMLAPAGQAGEGLFSSLVRVSQVVREESRLRDRAMEVLELLSLEHLAMEYAGNLSTGQKRLIEIGRVLMADPDLILLDEPASGVNPGLMESLLEQLREINRRGKTIFLIEHDIDLVMGLCDPVVVMNLGRKIKEGPPGEVREDPMVLEAYLGG